MKTVFTTQEGVKMNANLDLGDTKDIINEFQYLMDTNESMLEVDFKYFYRITDDNYIQLAYRMDRGELQLGAQYKLRFKNLKENIVFIVKQNIEAHLPYHGYPTFENSSVFTRPEFDSIIQTMQDEKTSISEKAKLNETPLISYLREQQLEPEPTGHNPYSWVARCPCGGKHHIMIVTKTDEWGCGYCRREGKLPELEKWLCEIKIKEDQKRLTKMLNELEEHKSIKSKETLKWWLNRY